MYRRIDHIGVLVADLEKSIAWYVDKLGWVLKHEEYIPDAGVRVAHLLPAAQNLEGGATSVQLLQPIEPGGMLDQLQSRGEGLHHICFEVADVSLALEEMGDDSERIFTGGRDQLACFLGDTPDGVLIELIEGVLAPEAQPERV